MLAAAGTLCVAAALGGASGPVQPPLFAGAANAAAAQVGAANAAAQPTRPRAPVARRTAVLPSSPPTALAIPAIGVAAALVRLGQAADGTIEVPAPGPGYDSPGWYRYSPTPGSLGPAVIVGHLDSARSGPSVFYRLGELRSGDAISVSRSDGTVAVFAVQEVRRFGKADFPTALVYGNTDHAALRLITCGGPFDRASGHYRDNIVVTASLVQPA